MEKRFNSFNGVFLPTFLTIIGVIYFLRLGWVVGNAGLLGAISIIVLAHVITISTALSMASISTNMKVEGGGAYYMISRSLGLEIGGSIGIPLYLSQAISVSLYVIGFIESIKQIFPSFFEKSIKISLGFIHTDLNTLIISLIITIIIGLISIIGADLAVKAQYFIFGILILAIINIVFSGNYDNEIVLVGNFSESKNYFQTFAIFFPAVTGILAGVSMSGDLKNPKKDIPKGTFWAIGITFLIYLFQTFWFSKNISVDASMDKLILVRNGVTKFPIIVILGIWAATLSSALGSIIAAPRTMQALARDGVLPRGSGKNDEPKIATILTFFIALFFILMGNLDIVAPVITMFFLNTYGAVNLVSGLEVMVGNPSFRPTFKTPWYVSLIGALGSYSVMFLINKMATIASIIIILAIYFYLSNKNFKTTWGDLRTGIWAAIARFSLLKIRFDTDVEINIKEKNWKPNILVFSGTPNQRQRLIYLADVLSKGKGIIILLTYIIGEIENKIKTKKIIMENMRKYIQENNILAFPEVIIAKSMREASTYAVQANGIGSIKSNTVLLGLTENKEHYVDYVGFLMDMINIDRNIILLKYDEEREFGNKKQIDIWWGGLENNGRLMLTIAHIFSLNDEWKNVNITLKSIITNKETQESKKQKLEYMLEYLGMKAKVEMIHIDGKKVKDIIHENSQNADLVIMGLAKPILGMEEDYINRIYELTETLPTTLLVKGVNLIEK